MGTQATPKAAQQAGPHSSCRSAAQYAQSGRPLLLVRRQPTLPVLFATAPTSLRARRSQRRKGQWAEGDLYPTLPFHNSLSRRCNSEIRARTSSLAVCSGEGSNSPAAHRRTVCRLTPWCEPAHFATADHRPVYVGPAFLLMVRRIDETIRRVPWRIDPRTIDRKPRRTRGAATASASRRWRTPWAEHD
jgi:hypothetical protein